MRKIVVAPLMLIVLIAAAMLAAGCESPTEKAQKKLVEKTVKKASGGEVDVDLNKQKIEVNTKDGKGSFSTEKKLPEHWPSELKMDKSFEIFSNSTIEENNNKTSMVIFANKKMGAEEALSYFEKRLAGWEKSNNFNSSTGDGMIASAAFTRGESETVSVNVIETKDSEDGTQITASYTVRKDAE